MSAAALVPTSALAQGAPPRIVSMDLVFTEMLLTMGAAPVAIGHVALYHRLVGEPKAPRDAVDLGPLTEPNLELLQYLAPDLILAASWQAPALAPLQTIAPVTWLPTFSREQKPLDFTRGLMARIGELSGRRAQAATISAQTDAAVSDSIERIRPLAGRPVYLLRFAEDGRRAAIFSAGSLVGDIANRTGLRNAFAGRGNVWGTASIGIERLVDTPDATIIHFERGAETVRAMKRLEQSPIWKALPAVRAGRVVGMPVVHPNGGMVSAARFARQLADTLSALGPVHG